MRRKIALTLRIALPRHFTSSEPELAMHILVALAFFAFAALVSPSFARRDLVEFNPNIDWVCKLFDSTGPLGGLPVMRYRARLGLDETLSDNW